MGMPDGGFLVFMVKALFEAQKRKNMWYIFTGEQAICHRTEMC